MLRDYKLAYSTYDIVRKDFGNDKAWKYAAGAQVFRKRKRITEYQEMTATSLLFLPSPLTMAKRTELLEPLLDSAFYSYTARLSSPYLALRMVLVSVELLCLKGGTVPDEAVRWITRALGTGSVGDYGTCLLIERIAAAYKIMHPRRKRKMALWSMIACENWIGVGCKGFAMRCLKDAARVYKDCPTFTRIEKHMNGLMESLGVQREVSEKEEIVDMQHEDGSEGITVEFA
jgi:trafficking protein particle complex subunit 8